MNIKEIVDQEKQKELFKKSKHNQEKHLKRLFLKDCYQMWKDYKKVENPYFWWLEKDWSFYEWYYFNWFFTEAPDIYTNKCQLLKKWDFDYCFTTLQHKIKRKTNPNDTWIYLD